MCSDAIHFILIVCCLLDAGFFIRAYLLLILIFYLYILCLILSASILRAYLHFDAAPFICHALFIYIYIDICLL